MLRRLVGVCSVFPLEYGPLAPATARHAVRPVLEAWRPRTGHHSRRRSRSTHRIATTWTTEWSSIHHSSGRDPQPATLADRRHDKGKAPGRVILQGGAEVPHSLPHLRISTKYSRSGRTGPPNFSAASSRGEPKLRGTASQPRT